MMGRFLSVLAVACGALALLAPPATAEDPVHVEDADEVVMEAPQTLALLLHIPGVGEVVQTDCTYHWEASISEEGHADIHTVEIDPPGTGPCAAWDDCGGTGWEGQLHEEEDNSGFEMQLVFCFNTSGTPLQMTCAITNAHLLCDSALIEDLSGNPTSLEMDGEVTFHSPVSISHAGDR